MAIDMSAAYLKAVTEVFPSVESADAKPLVLDQVDGMATLIVSKAGEDVRLSW